MAKSLHHCGRTMLHKRATDIAEREVMRAIHETRCNEPMCEDVVAAHRDPSLLNAVIITEIPNNDIEQETWSTGDEYDRRKRKIVWKNIPDFKVIFHPLTAINKYKNKQEFIQKFDLIWIAHNMTKHLSNVIPLAKLNARILVESRKFMVDLRKEDLEKFTKELINDAKENGMETIHKFDSEKDNIARFLKRSVVSQEII